MLLKKIGLIAFSCVAFSAAHANWVCDVANDKGQHWTYSAPTEASANSMAKNACDANSVNPANCNPSCTDNSATGGGNWRCMVSNKKGEHWTFSSPNQNQAYQSAKSTCDANSNNDANCVPSCVQE